VVSGGASRLGGDIHHPGERHRCPDEAFHRPPSASSIEPMASGGGAREEPSEFLQFAITVDRRERPQSLPEPEPPPRPADLSPLEVRADARKARKP